MAREFARRAQEILPSPVEAEGIVRRRKKGPPALKILFVGDPHFKEDNIVETQLLQERVVALIKAEGVDTVVVMGDVLDRHGLMHSTAHTRATHFLSEIHRLARVVLIIGNHDMCGPKAYMDGIHGFNAFKEWDRFVVVDRSMNFAIGHLRVVGVPYVYKGLFNKALREQDLDYRQADLILAHQEFKGVLGPFSDGDDWADDNPLVVTGHIHDYSWHRRNILYTGAPMMKTYGEKQPKTVSMFVYEDGSTVPTERRFDLKIPPRITTRIAAADALAWELPPDIAALPISHRRLKLKVTGSAQELASLRKSGKFLQLEKQGVKVEPKPHVETPKTAGLQEIEELREKFRGYHGEEPERAAAPGEESTPGGLFQTCVDRYVQSKKEAAEGIYDVYQDLVSKAEEAL